MSGSLSERVLGLIAARERGALTKTEEKELLGILEEDPELAALAGWDRAVDRLLRYAWTMELDGEQFTRGVAARIAAESRGEEFVSRVTRESRRLRSRRWSAPPKDGVFVLASAAACAAILLLAAAFNHGQGPLETRTPRTVSNAEIHAEVVEAPAEPRKAPAPRIEPQPPPTAPARPAAHPSLAEAPPKAPEPSARPPEAPPPPELPRATLAVVGTVERSEGAEGLQPLLAGQTVKGKAVLRLNDGTRLELGEGAGLQIPAAGRRFSLARGTLVADVAPQPRDRALVFETPHGEAAVLGTAFRLVVEAGSTRLDVTEGNVRLSRASDGKSIEVTAGTFAVAAAGIDLKARPIPDPRVTEGLRTLYVFDEGKGRVIRDVSGVGAPLHLVAKDESALSWIPGGGLALRTPTLIASSGPATKILGACRTSRAITMEAWIRPVQPERGTLRYIAALGGPRKEAMALGLGLHVDVGSGPATYRVYLTTPRTLPLSDYVPELESRPIVPGLAHLVFTRAASGASVLYVDGQERGSGKVEGDFSTWSESLRLMLGDASFDGVRPWVGEFHLLAIYNRALTPDEVLQNLAAGKRRFPALKK